MQQNTRSRRSAVADWRRLPERSLLSGARSTCASRCRAHGHTSATPVGLEVAALAVVLAMSGCATFQDRGVPPGGEYGYQFVIRHELNPRVYIYTSEVYRTHTEARAALAEHLILFPSQAEYAEVLGVPYPDDGNAEWPQLPS